MSANGNKTLWSIGHSKHSIEVFTNLLADNAIEVVADVRTSPYSRMAPQFNLAELKQSLKLENIEYIPMGESLGGRPNQNDFYDVDGHVFYDMMAQTHEFQAGLDRLIEGISKYRVAIMCSEGSPLKCHRTLLIARVLQLKGFNVQNILPDGSVQQQENLNALINQDSLFPDEEVLSWRSAVSVRQESVHETSSFD